MTMEEARIAHLANQETVIPDLDPDPSMIPSEYHEFADLFSKQEADKLPTHRPYDYTIRLEPGKVPPFGPMYKLSPIYQVRGAAIHLERLCANSDCLETAAHLSYLKGYITFKEAYNIEAEKRVFTNRSLVPDY